MENRGGEEGLRTDHLWGSPELVDMLTIGVLLFADQLPRERRREEMATGLAQIVRVLNLEGYAAPLWLTRPAEHFQRVATMDEEQAERETAHAVLGFIEGMLKTMDERVRPEARRALLAFFLDLYETNELQPPPWLVEALEEAGGRTTPLPPD